MSTSQSSSSSSSSVVKSAPHRLRKRLVELDVDSDSDSDSDITYRFLAHHKAITEPTLPYTRRNIVCETHAEATARHRMQVFPDSVRIPTEEEFAVVAMNEEGLARQRITEIAMQTLPLLPSSPTPEQQRSVVMITVIGLTRGRMGPLVDWDFPALTAAFDGDSAIKSAIIAISCLFQYIEHLVAGETPMCQLHTNVLLARSDPLRKRKNTVDPLPSKQPMPTKKRRLAENEGH
jgi:hypothetical protein